MHSVLVKEGAQKSLLRLPKKDAQRIVSALNALGGNPRPRPAVKLEGVPHAYRIRKGDYRILYTVDGQRRIVTVYRIAHRREAYR